MSVRTVSTLIKYNYFFWIAMWKCQKSIIYPIFWRKSIKSYFFLYSHAHLKNTWNSYGTMYIKVTSSSTLMILYFSSWIECTLLTITIISLISTTVHRFDFFHSLSFDCDCVWDHLVIYFVCLFIWYFVRLFLGKHPWQKITWLPYIVKKAIEKKQLKTPF